MTTFKNWYFFAKTGIINWHKCYFHLFLISVTYFRIHKQNSKFNGMSFKEEWSFVIKVLQSEKFLPIFFTDQKLRVWPFFFFFFFQKHITIKRNFYKILKERYFLLSG